MTITRNILQNTFEQVQNLLKDQCTTIVMDNQGSTRGQLYTISTATHDQAAKGQCGTMLFMGTAKEATIYLRGYSDLLRHVAPQLLPAAKFTKDCQWLCQGDQHYDYQQEINKVIRAARNVMGEKY